MTSIGHIYKIICQLDSSIIFIGSTFNELSDKWENHKFNYKIKNGKYSFHKYFDKYGIDNFKIMKIKSYNVVRTHLLDFKHLRAYETLWVNKSKNCINKRLPFSPMRYINAKLKAKEYYQENKEKVLEYQKEYREKNTVIINCPCGGTYQERKKNRHYKTKKHIKYVEQKKD